MLIEMKQGEKEVVMEMLGGPITPAFHQLYKRVRGRLLNVGHNYDMPKDSLAILVELSAAVTTYNETHEPQRKEPREKQEHKDITPVDEMSERELEAAAVENASYNGDAAGGEYTGNRIKWKTDFKSTPSTAISKLEKGRPISYISPNDGKTRAAKFVRMNAKDKSLANIMSSEMKRVFGVPIKNITVTDLSRPSTIPLAVQI